MSWDQVAKRWREPMVERLQSVYGLPEDEALTRAEAWLGWLKKQWELDSRNFTVQAVQPVGWDSTGKRRPQSGLRCRKSSIPKLTSAKPTFARP